MGISDVKNFRRVVFEYMIIHNCQVEDVFFKKCLDIYGSSWRTVHERIVLVAKF